MMFLFVGGYRERAIAFTNAAGAYTISLLQVSHTVIVASVVVVAALMGLLYCLHFYEQEIVSCNSGS